MRVLIGSLAAVAVCCVVVRASSGQTKIDVAKAIETLTEIPAVTGHEEAASKALLALLKDFHPKTDNLGNVYVSVGRGAPHRLIATSIDEPGYVVSEITPDGYLRVQRLPQAAPSPLFDSLNFAQPVVVFAKNGKQVPGVFAGLSVHLQPGRLNAPKMNHVEELYVDIGAESAEEVRAAGIDVLDPIALRQRVMRVGNGEMAGPGAVEQVGADAFLALLRRVSESKAPGSTTLAFVTQQWIGGRGLNRLLTEIHPDEILLLSRVAPLSEKDSKKESMKAGSGLLMGVAANPKQGTQQFASYFNELASKEQIQLQTVTIASPRIASYTKGAELPEKLVELGISTLWPVTPAETVSREDAARLQRLLEAYLEIAKPRGGFGGGSGGGREEGLLEALTVVYGASGHEEAVRKVVLNRLPTWAQSKARTDAAGNLALHLGSDKSDEKTPRIAFVAHMDEIGYEVKKIEDDGRLQVDVLGGGYLQYFLGHVVLLHKKDGNIVGGVLELPTGWDKPGFEWPTSFRSMDEPAHVYVGTRSKEETEKLGIAVGDFVTIPKEYRALLGTRANARSFDDRVGCAALIQAVRAIGPDLPGRDVTFVWSTQEEVGLKGAAAFAEQAAKENRVPDFVFAVDTFVSADSPLESKRFGGAEIGKGFVVRAVDNSNVVPLEYVNRVVQLAKENNVSAQYGVTGGGNDGAVFLRYGSVDVALGWPLRYSHSPGEVIDTKDLDALGKIVEVIARKW